MSNAHVWRATQERLRREMTRAQFDTWLRGTQLSVAPGDTLVLSARTTFAKEMLENSFRERIESALAQVLGRRCTLRVVVAAAADDDDEAPVVAPAREPVRGHTRATAATARPIGTAAAVAFAQPLFSTTALSDHQDDMRAARSVSVEPARVPRTGDPDRGGPRSEARGEPPARAGTARIASQGHASGRDGVEPEGRRRYTPPGWADSGGASGRAQTRAVAAHGARDGMASMVGYDDDETPRGEQHEPATPANHEPDEIPVPRLNARYTFDTFIVGRPNQLAHAASLAVAEAPGQAYNPLFLYGDVGLGKTHLLHAVGHTALSRGLTVLYVSSETFTNEIVNAIRYRTTEEFRAKYRSVDVLLVDDIQFIAGKESTEEEFFHTFNSLYETNKQIVICSDRPPKAIVSVQERLRSRFEWGLISDIQPPDHEMRVAILRAKADRMGRRVPDDVIAFLASRVQSNIRELEGCFNRLLALAELQEAPLSIDIAKAAVANLTSDGRQRTVSPDDVLGAVAEYYHIPVDDLQGKQRDKFIVMPRQIAMYLMRQETDASLLEIGQALGGRDHSTVLHGCEKISREFNDNGAVRKEVLAIRQQLLG